MTGSQSHWNCPLIYTLLSRFLLNRNFLYIFQKSIDLPPCGRFIFQVKARPSLNKKAVVLIRKKCNLIRKANLIQKSKI
jgi:hypothetical protein